MVDVEDCRRDEVDVEVCRRDEVDVEDCRRDVVASMFTFHLFTHTFMLGTKVTL